MLENLPKYVVLSILMVASLAYIRAFGSGTRILRTGRRASSTLATDILKHPVPWTTLA